MKKITITRDDVEKILAAHPEVTSKVVVVGIRGYDEDSNQIGIYDDAAAILSPDVFKVYNFNTDPSRALPGVAVLQPGVYEYAKGIHGIHHLNLNVQADRALYNQLQGGKLDLDPIPGRILPYWALRQHSNVTIKRQGSDALLTDSPASRFWIDIHRGGYNTTSSEGCQTVFPDQWIDFRKTVFEEMDKNNLTEIQYLLIQ